MDNIAQEAIYVRAILGNLQSKKIRMSYPGDVGCALDENTVKSEGEILLVVGYHSMSDHVDPYVLEVPTNPIQSPEDELSLAAGTGILVQLCDPNPGIHISVAWAKMQLATKLEMFKTTLPNDTFRSVKDRLELFLGPEEWEEDEVLPVPSSFERMLNFLAGHHDLPLPRTAIARNGNFIASWRADRDNLVNMEFLPNGMVRWLVFAPPKAPAQQIERAAGESPANSVMARVASFRVKRWLRRGQG